MSTFQSRSIFKNAYRSDIMRLFIICGGLFIFLWFIETIFQLTDDGRAVFFAYFKNPLQLPFAFAAFIKQPWSLLTFGFMESNSWALFSNMVWLWIFGSLIEDLKGTNRVLPIFWVGFVFAGIVLMLVHVFYPLGSGLYMSTLAGVAAVAAAAITYKPMYGFYKIFNTSLPIFVFGIIFVILTFAIRGANLASILVFFSGASIGFLSQNVLRSFFEKAKNVLEKSRTYFSSNENFIKKGKKKTNLSVELPENARMRSIQHKINTQGLESITAAEQDFLDKFEP